MAAPTLASPEFVACPVADEILVERIRSGEHEAFGELYERYFARIFRFVARRLRNRADTEETVQEVFVSVFASIDSFRGEAPFGAWLFGLTGDAVVAGLGIVFAERDEIGNPLLEASGDRAPRESEDPSAKRRLTTEGIDRSEHVDEDLLDGLLGVRAIP